ncbi:MAG: hypothetical protein M3462_05040 [Chloroflexota bacterium]|nr:hypothetical protein [Chloroflexota bacterium]
MALLRRVFGERETIVCIFSGVRHGKDIGRNTTDEVIPINRNVLTVNVPPEDVRVFQVELGSPSDERHMPV